MILELILLIRGLIQIVIPAGNLKCKICDISVAEHAISVNMYKDKMKEINNMKTVSLYFGELKVVQRETISKWLQNPFSFSFFFCWRKNEREKRGERKEWGVGVGL